MKVMNKLSLKLEGMVMRSDCTRNHRWTRCYANKSWIQVLFPQALSTKILHRYRPRPLWHLKRPSGLKVKLSMATNLDMKLIDLDIGKNCAMKSTKSLRRGSRLWMKMM